MFTPAPRPTGPRDRVPPIVKKRGDGLDRRPLAGIARERETSAHDVAPFQGGAVLCMTCEGVQEDPIMRVSPGRALQTGIAAAGGETALTVYSLGLPASAGVCLPPWYFRLNLHHGFQPRDPF